MKPILYTALLLAAPAILFAQPTITKMENHTIGTIVKQARDTTHFPAPGNAGANQTWSFTMLAPQDTLTERIVSPSTTQFGSNFPDASYVRITDNASYTYIQKAATENYMVGAVDSASGTMTKYYDKTVYSQIPLIYQKSTTDNYTSLNGIYPDTSKGSIQAVADGWGTLVLPNGTYNNVIRVKLLIHQVDSIPAGPTKLAGILDATTYLWYDNQHYSPLMRWDSTHYDYGLGQLDLTNITYMLSETYPVSVSDLIHKDRHSASIIGGSLMIAGNFEQGMSYTLSLFDLNGQTIQSGKVIANGQLRMLLNADLPPGMYFATLRDAAGTIETIRVIKQ